VQIRGRAGVPADAWSVVLNVTITEPDGDGYATVFPCGTPRPLASNLNAFTGDTIANLVISNMGADGTVCIFTQAKTHLVVDVDGWFPTSSRFTGVQPARLLDTRPGVKTVDGQGAGIGIRAAGTVTPVKVTGRGGVPANATAVILNATVDGGTAAGYLTVYPCGIAPPLASNLNFVAGDTVPNSVIARLGDDGTVCVFNSQGTHVIVDVDGYFTS